MKLTINIIRSSFIGTFIGILSGVGGPATCILPYSQDKNFSKDPEKLGSGVAEAWNSILTYFQNITTKITNRQRYVD